METGINLMAIFIANGFGIILSLLLLLGNNNQFRNNNKEYTIIQKMLFLAIISCISDPIVFLFNGRPGKLSYFIVYFGNLWLYVGNMLIGPGWLYLIIKHLIGKTPKAQKLFMIISCSIGLFLLVVNLFVPIVFTVTPDNIYERRILYWLYTAIEGAYLLDGLFVYLYGKVKGGIFKFFPVIQFIIPILLGMITQSLFYGVSVICPSVTVSLCGLLIGLQNEALYMDSLTGLYNRAYLHSMYNIMEKSKSVKIGMMMVDMNDFKYINDTFGHSEGDVALCAASTILKNTIGPLGSAIRYAGDEFIVLLNVKDIDIVKGCALSIKKNIEEYNASMDKGYKLSLAIGYCVFDPMLQTFDEALGRVDKLMYEDKSHYYEENKRLGFRGV